MTTKYDLIVVGGGILGTFHAYHALKRGLKVALIEKILSRKAQQLEISDRLFPQEWILNGRISGEKA